MPKLGISICVILPFIWLLSGCDAFLRVQGVVVAPDSRMPPDCVASLHDEKNDYSFPRDVDGSFEHAWTVSPSTENFELRIRCNGYRTQRVRFKARVGEPADVGRIVLEPE